MGAIVGGLIGLLTALAIMFFKNRKFKKLMSTAPQAEYAALYHYAHYSRYKKSLKFYDSFGPLYVIGNNLYYKADANKEPMVLDLTQCTVQPEPDWRMLKWFSVTTPVGEKHYFNSHVMGAFKGDSSETDKGLAFLQAKTRGAKQPS